MKRPSADDLYLAALWLDVYEGAEDAEACKRVARWLEQQSLNAELADMCRKAGVSVKQARAAIKKAEARK